MSETLTVEIETAPVELEHTPVELEYTPVELEFMAAMETYLQRRGKESSEWSDVLKVLEGLGY